MEQVKKFTGSEEQANKKYLFYHDMF